MKNLTLPILDNLDRQLLNEWNNTQADYPLTACFPQLFEQQVARTPNAVAVIFKQQQLTYHQLNTRANRWARHLVGLGVGLEKIVGLMGDRNIDFLTAILAIFKAGGAYLPLNPAHPAARNQQVLAQSQVTLVLASQNCHEIIAPMVAQLESQPQLLDLEDLDRVEYDSDNLVARCCPDNLAYVIYTSGSTGPRQGP